MPESKGHTKSGKRTCFVIGPIGAPGSDDRIKADWVLKGIIEPVLTNDPFDYEVIRSDTIAEPGLITEQIISHVLDADLVIADLTGHNPNAFYELAVRHMANGKTIHIVSEDETLPFDIKDYRAIFYKLVHPDDLDAARDLLAKQVTAIEKPNIEVSNPITKARRFQQFQKSADPKDKMIASLVTSIDAINQELRTLKARLPMPATTQHVELSPLAQLSRDLTFRELLSNPSGNGQTIGRGGLSGFGGLVGGGALDGIGESFDNPRPINAPVMTPDTTVSDLLKSRGVPGPNPDPTADRDIPSNPGNEDSDEKS